MSEATGNATEPEVKKKGRKQRRDKGSILVTERDLVVLRWIGEQYCVRLDQLQYLLGRESTASLQEESRVQVTTAQRVLDRWRRAGWVETQKFLHGQPFWIWLTRAGLKLVELAFRYGKPSVGTLRHHYWTNQVRLKTEERQGAAAMWYSERALRAGGDRGVVTLPGGRRHTVDAEIVVNEVAIALEVELTPKKQQRLQVIMQHVAGSYATTWYFAPDTVIPLLERTRALLSQGLHDRVRIYDLTQVQ